MVAILTICTHEMNTFSKIITFFCFRQMRIVSTDFLNDLNFRYISEKIGDLNRKPIFKDFIGKIN